MSAAASGLIPRDADEKLARIILEAGAMRSRADELPADGWAACTSSASAVRVCPASPVCCSPAGCRSAAATASPRRPSTPCGPWAPGCTSATTRGTSTTSHRGTRSSSRLRSSADNPEYAEAISRGLRVLPRAAAMAAVMEGRRVVAVAGTHGKTTTTSLLTVALQAAGADPTYAIGGDLSATGVNAAEGTGDLFVAEADESDGAFLVYRPHGAIVTNVEADHLDHWLTEEAYAAAFEQFADRSTGPGSWSAAPTTPGRPVWRTGSGPPDAGWSPCPPATAGPTWGRPRWTVCRSGRRVSTTSPTPWRRYAAGVELGCRPGCAEGRHRVLHRDASSHGVQGRGRGSARLRQLRPPPDRDRRRPARRRRALAGDGRLLVAFQPHLVSRTRVFGAAMGEALGAADEVVVCDVYLAREDADPAVTGVLVADAVPLPPDRVAFVARLADVAAELVARSRPGDLVLTLGAGDVTEVGPQLLTLLAERARA